MKYRWICKFVDVEWEPTFLGGFWRYL